MLDPSIFLQAAITVKNPEDEIAITLSCDASLFERLDDLAINHELFIPQAFMNMYLKLTDELKQIKGKSMFYVPVYVLSRLFGVDIERKKSGVEDDPAKYSTMCNAQGSNIQAFIDVADKIRAFFKTNKLKQFTHRINSGRGFQAIGPALVKKIEAFYLPASKMPDAKDSGDCSPDKIEKIYEDMLDFIEFNGPVLIEKKATFTLLESVGLPTTNDRKPNPDLVERDRSFLKDKFKGVKSRNFKFLVTKLNSGRFILINVRDPLLT
jgi:hypothetical protein